MHWNQDGRSLSNSAAKPVAEKLYAELAAEFHPTAVIKLLTNLNRIHQRERKNAQVRHQMEIAEQPARAGTAG